MLRALILAALLALVTSRVNARLWETISQTEARYGGALQTFTGDNPAEEQRKYRYKDFYVLVEFLDGRSDDEWYFHTDGKTPLSDGEIQFFLSMTSGGKRWQKSSDVSDEPVWTLGGSSLESWKAVAVYYPKLPRTTIPGFGIYTIARAKESAEDSVNTSNQSMKPTAPDAMNASNLATPPCRGLSLSR